MCEVDITERRRHQGGRLLFEHDGEAMDMRVSFYITVHGEKIVLRLLNRQTELLNIEDIGMFTRMVERFRLEALDCPSGVVIATGPTGSGKTTTLYSCINYLNNPQTSIITAEEPVEYVIEGIAQCSINPKINLTFEETLRHIVRQDPDVIVIGEIRDSYSAEVAVQAALTGHKVLTTFHTEDSIGGLIRLLNMDIDAFLISSTVHNAIIRIGTGELLLLLLQHDDVGFIDSFCGSLTEKLWRHSMGCAVGTHWLAKQCGFDALAHEAYIAGLLHDVGKLLLITVVENITRSGKKKLRPSNELLCEVMDNFHAEHGYLLLKSWNLPESFCKVAQEHHYEDVDPNDILLIIVRLANKACNKLGIGLSKDPSIILAATPEANLLGLSEVLLAELEIILEDSMTMILQGDSNLNMP